MADDIQLDVEQVAEELKIRPEIYVRIVKSFSETLKEKIVVLSKAVADRDTETMRKVLHEIKGTAGNLRLRGVSEAESVMHNDVKANASTDKLMPELAALRKESEKLTQFVAQYSN